MELKGKFKSFVFKKTDKSLSFEHEGELYYFSSRDSKLPSDSNEEVTLSLRGSFFAIKPSSQVLKADEALAIMNNMKSKKEQ